MAAESGQTIATPRNNDHVCIMAIPKESVTALCHDVLIVVDTSRKLERETNLLYHLQHVYYICLNFMTGITSATPAHFWSPSGKFVTSLYQYIYAQ